MPVDIARVKFAVSEYRKTSEKVDAAVQTRDPLATSLEFTSLLENEADANTFANSLLDFYKVGRYDWTLNVKKNVINPQIGDTITVKYPRFGLQSGKNFIVKRIKKSQSGLFDEFTLYGPQ